MCVPCISSFLGIYSFLFCFHSVFDATDVMRATHRIIDGKRARWLDFSHFFLLFLILVCCACLLLCCVLASFVFVFSFAKKKKITQVSKFPMTMFYWHCMHTWMLESNLKIIFIDFVLGIMSSRNLFKSSFLKNRYSIVTIHFENQFCFVYNKYDIFEWMKKDVKSTYSVWKFFEEHLKFIQI